LAPGVESGERQATEAAEQGKAEELLHGISSVWVIGLPHTICGGFPRR
jgi:hypothetical protein